jgi:hypothetical protein
MNALLMLDIEGEIDHLAYKTFSGSRAAKEWLMMMMIVIIVLQSSFL